MKMILEYSIPPFTSLNIKVPIGAKPLTIQLQKGIPILYYLADLEQVKTTRKIRTMGTNHEIDDSFEAKYVGSYKKERGTYVYHVFEETIT